MTKRQALVLYHIAGRELIINKMYKECLEVGNIVDEVIIEEAYKAISQIYLYNPEIIICFLPRDEYSSYLFTLLKFVNNCKFIAIPTEGYFRLSEENVNILVGHNRCPEKLVDYYYFWGNGVKEIAEKILIKDKKITTLDRIRVFGYLTYEKDLLRKNIKRTTLDIELEEKKKQYKKIFLIVTAIMAKDVTIEEMIAESAFKLDDDEAFNNAKLKIESHRYYNDLYVEQIYVAAKKHPEFLFLVKKHPAESGYLVNHLGKTRYDKFQECDNIITIDEEQQISVFFDNISLFIHYGSTAAMEAYVYKIPTLQLTNDYKEFVPDALGREVPSTIHIKVSDKEALAEVIKNEIIFNRDTESEQELYQFMNYEYDKEYKPSEWLIEHLKNSQKPQRLYITDKEVRRRIFGRPCLSHYKQFFKQYFKSLFSGDFNKCRKIRRWFLKFFVRILGA